MGIVVRSFAAAEPSLYADVLLLLFWLQSGKWSSRPAWASPVRRRRFRLPSNSRRRRSAAVAATAAATGRPTAVPRRPPAVPAPSLASPPVHDASRPAVSQTLTHSHCMHGRRTRTAAYRHDRTSWSGSAPPSGARCALVALLVGQSVCRLSGRDAVPRISIVHFPAPLCWFFFSFSFFLRFCLSYAVLSQTILCLPRRSMCMCDW